MIVSFGVENARALGLVESAKHRREAHARSKRLRWLLSQPRRLSLSRQARLSNAPNACILAHDARFALQPRSQGVFHFCKMDIGWDDLRLFLDVARLGGLSAATGTTRLSAATLGRRVTALEKQIGEPLFVRQQTGYRLTPVGEELLRRAEDVEAAMQSLTRWREGNLPDRIVRVSAGPWTSAFVSAHIGEIWTVDDGIRVELVTTTERVDIGHRAADIGIRSERPTEQWLAGRQSGKVAHAILFRTSPDQRHRRWIVRRRHRRRRKRCIGALAASPSRRPHRRTRQQHPCGA
ncbi:LysR family transcriptional regulator [Mesorhizobium sp. M0174]|uniref:LysR family transcriptional regulator n=1 Tax=Mesorhizobium sp. M0174 TaxID=2956904 RepID=UPI00333AF02B